MITPETRSPFSDEELSAAERKLLAAASTGIVVDLRGEDTGLNDPRCGANWGDERTVRAELLAGLLTGDLPAHGGQPRAVRLRGARITGPLDLQERALAIPLSLQDCHIEQPVNLNEATAPAVRLPGCHLPALTARQLRTTGDVQLGDGFTTRGQVHLAGAHIGGQLNLTRAVLENGNRTALDGNGLTVEQGMVCSQGFSAHGEVKLAGAHIGGQLNLTAATLTNENGTALDGNGLTVDRDMVCSQGFSAHGEVNLVNAKVGSFLDDPASWPLTMRLRGFVYDTLDNDQASVRQRLDWISRDAGGYVPQVYDQLATAYRNAGREGEARRVAIAKQRRRRNALNPLNWLWYATVGYGYRTWLAGAWLVAFLAVGTWMFSRAHMIATSAHPPAFHPFAYAVDVIVPIVGLGQKSAWEPQGTALYWSWALTGAGWVLTTAVVAGLTGILKRD